MQSTERNWLRISAANFAATAVGRWDATEPYLEKALDAALAWWVPVPFATPHDFMMHWTDK